MSLQPHGGPSFERFVRFGRTCWLVPAAESHWFAADRQRLQSLGHHEALQTALDAHYERCPWAADSDLVAEFGSLEALTEAVSDGAYRVGVKAQVEFVHAPAPEPIDLRDPARDEPEPDKHWVKVHL